MTQRDRDRLVVLKKAQKKLITQKQAAVEIDVSERQVRRMLRGLREVGDKAVTHGLRGRSSNRKLSEADRKKAIAILSQDQYRDFGPTLASEELRKRHDLSIGREALRQLMTAAGLWHPRRLKLTAIHVWRERRSCRGELVQWDTSEHDWLEGRGGEKLYLIAMIDDATGELTARFALHDSTEQNMRLVWDYLEKNGRPVMFYTDKASLFQTTPKVARDDKPLSQDGREPLPPTQIGRALQELQIAWMPAHSPQAKGRIERVFGTAQDRLVKGLRLADAATLEQAQEFLQQDFIPWWNRTLKVRPASSTDAHRPLGSEHNLASALSHVEARHVTSDYTFQLAGKLYQITRSSIVPGLRGSKVRAERRLDGLLAISYCGKELTASLCEPRPKVTAPAKPKARTASKSTQAERTAAWRRSGQDLFKPGPATWVAAAIDRTRTTDKLD